MRRTGRAAGVGQARLRHARGALLLGLAGSLAGPAGPVGAAAVPELVPCAPFAEPLTAAPAYYAIELVSTRRVPGTRATTGVAHARFASSPFAVSLAPAGAYRTSLEVQVEGLPRRVQGVYALWITTPELDHVRFAGLLDEAGQARAEVTSNKFLVVISLEQGADALGERWQGPIVLRGMSRSGRMHTMAGHGPFEGEPCVKFGY